MSSTFTKFLAPALGALVVVSLQVFPASTASAVEGGTATQINAGGYHACAITPAERLKCWGYNSVGQLGIGNTDNQYEPRLVPNLENVKRVAIGNYTTCAIVGNAGKLKCWGENDYGQIGDGTNDDSDTPVLTIEKGVKQVDIGEYHTCAVFESGKAKCWGSNDYAELGTRDFDDRLRPAKVEGLDNVKNISAGYEYTCATVGQGKAKCWGKNDYGVIGDNTYDDRKRPTQVKGLDKNVTVVKAGYYTSCAIVGKGRLKCWGTDYYGEVGTGTTVGDYPKPVQVIGMESGVKSVDPDYYFTCAVKGDAAKCWGNNDYGQIGVAVDDIDSRDVPTTPKGLGEKVVGINTAWYHVCALLKNGTARCWGYADDGEVGSGDEGEYQYETPQKVLL
jgi:alpha-tubulin suppressor-like RCC1 family protein